MLSPVKVAMTGLILIIALIMLLVFSVRSCSKSIEKRGGISEVISDMVVDVDKFGDDLKKKIDEKRQERGIE